MIESLKNIRRVAIHARTRLLRRCGWLVPDWEKGLPGEVKFWAQALRNPKQNWLQSEYDERMNADLPLQPFLRELIDAPAGATIQILDVGAGPLTRVGRKWEDHMVCITPVDPLATEYRKIFAELKLTPPIETIVGDGEKLREQFPDNSFDLAYASNSLDHAYDPVLAIRQMVAVVKPGASVYLWHFINVAVSEAYDSLHGWNFSEQRGDMTIDDGCTTRWLSTELADLADLRVHTEKAFGDSVVVARLRKKVSSTA